MDTKLFATCVVCGKQLEVDHHTKRDIDSAKVYHFDCAYKLLAETREKVSG